MSLCEQADVEAALQRSGLDSDTVTYLIEGATALIQDYCDQHLEAQDDLQVTLDGTGARWLFLPEVPARAVDSVVEDGAALSEDADDGYLWYENGRLRRTGTVWTGKAQAVVVTYDAGFAADEIPDTLRGICAEVVARAFRLAEKDAATPAGAGDIQAVSLEGSDSVTFATGGGSLAVQSGLGFYGRYLSLLDSDRFDLGPYRREAMA